MKELFAINPNRLEWCLNDFGVAISELSHSIGISEKTIEYALDGHAAISFGQLEKLAKFFGRGILFFIDPSPAVKDQIRTSQFRTIQNKKPNIIPEMRKLIERAEWQREVYLSILSESSDPESASPEVPIYPDLSAKAAGKQARTWLGLNDRKAKTIESYREALEKKGILVFRAQGYAGNWHWGANSPILGFSLFFKQFPVIVLKRATWETQQVFTLMHELGHLIIHRTGSIDSIDDLQSHEKNETDANKFAGHLLIPDEFLDQINENEHPTHVSGFEQWVSKVSHECGVSTDVVLIRLIEAGRVPQSEYDEYREWYEHTRPHTVSEGGSRQYRHREPIHIFGDRYVRTVLGALNERIITIPKASSYLDNIKLKDIHELERYYASV